MRRLHAGNVSMFRCYWGLRVSVSPRSDRSQVETVSKISTRRSLRDVAEHNPEYTHRLPELNRLLSWLEPQPRFIR